MFRELLKSLFSLGNHTNFVLRKTKSFNKSRYSRNRQYYRTGVYWCLWLNVILVTGLYYAFYRYTLKFSYVIVLYLVGMLSGLLSFFSKNYFLGLWEAIKSWGNPVAFDFIVKCREVRLNLKHLYDDLLLVTIAFAKYTIKKLISKWK